MTGRELRLWANAKLLREASDERGHVDPFPEFGDSACMARLLPGDEGYEADYPSQTYLAVKIYGADEERR